MNITLLANNLRRSRFKRNFKDILDHSSIVFNFFAADAKCDGFCIRKVLGYYFEWQEINVFVKKPCWVLKRKEDCTGKVTHQQENISQVHILLPCNVKTINNTGDKTPTQPARA